MGLWQCRGVRTIGSFRGSFLGASSLSPSLLGSLMSVCVCVCVDVASHALVAQSGSFLWRAWVTRREVCTTHVEMSRSYAWR